MKLLDFGIAALAGSPEESGTRRGTVHFMSPEQARGDPPDARTDVWSLGILLSRMLTGEAPFDGTASEVLTRILGIEPVPRLIDRRGIARPLAHVVDRALSKDPAARFSDAAAMLSALEEAAAAPLKARRRTVAAMVTLAGVAAFVMAIRLRPTETGTAAPILSFLPVRVEQADSATADLRVAVLDDVADRLTVVSGVTITPDRSGADGRGPEGRT